MSVHEADRKPQMMEVQNTAMALAQYTFREAGKDSVISKRNRWSLGERLLDAACDLVVHIEQANALRLDIPEEAAVRRVEQDMAMAAIFRIKTLVHIAREISGFPAKKHIYWTRLAESARVLISGWKESDRGRKRRMER